ncbi:type II toxin-antitoxin system VapC family toxin [Methylorubrum populi]|uniref:type II toxin-antitoxin system VapC family toxin n=1 Tax=Methylorubrum populi TaxID=223967 RepID=UPI00114DB40A|nr:type II toxin-antitoxin system VapC family toxin [Methylorubrum populi]QDI82691.1 type II toxin-antitoxin system VapC family toxin [Methylorubrum populi]
MRLLLDTHLLIWALGAPEKLPSSARQVIDDPTHLPAFSTASIWELAIKQSLARSGNPIDAALLRRTLLRDGYEELPVLGIHATAVAGLPLIHKDPFDRLLVAQATVEGITLLTSDAHVARYPGPIRRV